MRLRIVSRFQFALPAVELSFLLQIMRTPPVDDESLDSRPSVMVLSNSSRKASARACFFELNSFFCSMSFLSFFAGFLMGLFLAASDGERLPSSSKEGIRGVLLILFCGEYWSFQSLITSWLQKESVLGL